MTKYILWDIDGVLHQWKPNDKYWGKLDFDYTIDGYNHSMSTKCRDTVKEVVTNKENVVNFLFSTWLRIDKGLELANEVYQLDFIHYGRFSDLVYDGRTMTKTFYAMAFAATHYEDEVLWIDDRIPGLVYDRYVNETNIIDPYINIEMVPPRNLKFMATHADCGISPKQVEEIKEWIDG